jgi:GTPase SAR1 family protein
MADDPQQTAKASKGFLNRLKKTFRLGSQSKEAAKLAEAAKLRAKYSRFRILVIGRANAGKTTLLKRVCNTTEDPCIYDEDKNLVSHSLIVRSHSHRFFTNSSNRPPRCRLSDFCTTIRSDD